MHQKSETPLVGSGASRNSCGGCFRDTLNFSMRERQILVSRNAQSKLAALIVSFAEGENAPAPQQAVACAFKLLPEYAPFRRGWLGEL